MRKIIITDTADGQSCFKYHGYDCMLETSGYAGTDRYTIWILNPNENFLNDNENSMALVGWSYGATTDMVKGATVSNYTIESIDNYLKKHSKVFSD